MTNGVVYNKHSEDKWYTMDVLDVGDLTAYLGSNALELENNYKSLYNYVVYDSSTIEKPFALELQQSDDIKVFAKLPDKFYVETPLGNYNPDCAYVEEIDGREKVYFVVETKGRDRGCNTPSEEMKIDCAEKHFNALNNGIKYETKIHYKSVNYK